jgi:hypothetical protein
MTSALILPLLAVLTANPDDPTGFEQAAKTDGIVVYKRETKGSDVAEVKATGMIDAEPQAVWRVVRNYNGYKDTMPYTPESEVVKQTGNGKEIWFYSVVSAPMVSKRDYVIQLTDNSKWNDGKGYLRVDWKAVEGVRPERKGYVRVKLNTGFWKLEPREGGKKTFATYYVHTDPGGSLPKFIANQANNTAVPDVFRAVRKHVKAEQKKLADERQSKSASDKG